MRFLNPIKFIPIFLSLLIIILLNVNNQKESIKLRLLIWNTPSLSLGTYISFSSITGFVLSYLFTKNYPSSNQMRIKKKIRYKYDEIDHNTYINNEPNTDIPYDNNLIERDFNDPSPTLNASFRIIGNTNSKDYKNQMNKFNTNEMSEYSEESASQFYEKDINYKNNIINKSNQIDWEDESFLNW